MNADNITDSIAKGAARGHARLSTVSYSILACPLFAANRRSSAFIGVDLN